MKKRKVIRGEIERWKGEVAIKRGNPDLKEMGSTRLQGAWRTWTNWVFVSKIDEIKKNTYFGTIFEHTN